MSEVSVEDESIYTCCIMKPYIKDRKCQKCQESHSCYNYRIAGNFGGKIFWRIAENKSFGGIYFGGWASLLAIMTFITKWLIKRAGNLTGPWASFRSVRTKLMMKCNWKVHKSLLRLILTVFVASVFTATVYTSFGSPSSRWQTIQLFSHLRCTKHFGEAYAAFNGELHADYLDWRVQLQA